MNDIDFSKIYSPYKINLFEQCPKAYHFENLDEVYSKLKNKLKKDPANIWFFNTVGKAVHDAITLYLHLPLSEQTLTNLKEQLKKTWRSEANRRKTMPLLKWGGFINIEQERRYYFQALQMLVNFRKTFKIKNSIKFLPTTDINNSIEDFKKLIKPIEKDIYISGKFDLILETEEGLEIVDFKTGKEEKEENFQLQFYKILAELNFQQPVTKASFYYLRTANKRIFSFKKDESGTIKKIILTKIDKIKKEKDFLPKPSEKCRFCIFRSFCPAKKEVVKFTGEPIQEVLNEDLPF